MRAWVGRGRPSDVRGEGLSSSSLRNWVLVNHESRFVGAARLTYLHDDSAIIDYESEIAEKELKCKTYANGLITTFLHQF